MGSYMKRLRTILAIALLIAFTGLGVQNIVGTKTQVKLREVQLKDAGAQLKTLQLQYDQLLNDLDKAGQDKAKAEQLQKQLDDLKKEKEKLEQQLSAKREAQRVAQERLNNTASFSGTAYAAGGNKEQWMAAAGIPQNLWWAVDYIVSRESGWDPCAYYPSQSNCNASPSTACGLVQQNPCGKIGGSWTDPVAALKWQYNYVNDRYGGYAQAVAFWRVNNHY